MCSVYVYVKTQIIFIGSVLNILHRHYNSNIYLIRVLTHSQRPHYPIFTHLEKDTTIAVTYQHITHNETFLNYMEQRQKTPATQTWAGKRPATQILIPLGNADPHHSLQHTEDHWIYFHPHQKLQCLTTHLITRATRHPQEARFTQRIHSFLIVTDELSTHRQ